MNTLELDKKLEDIEKSVRAGGGDPPLCRRAGRIFRVKVYFLFRGQYNSPVINAMGWAASLPFEVKIISSFIISLAVLSALAYTGIAGFMMAMAPAILYITIICIMFSLLSRLAGFY